MSFLRRLLGSADGGATPAPHDDYWYRPVPGAYGAVSDSATALKLSAVWRCVNIIAGSTAMLPLQVFRRRPDGGKDLAPSHPLYGLLHDQPNRWQTSYDFREMLTAHALFRGNGYAEILPGARGFADQLWPLNPDRVKADQQRDGSIVYTVWRKDGTKQTLSDERVFHLRGLSDDGVTGVAVLDKAGEAFGLARKMEGFASKFFDQAPTPGGVIKHPKVLSDAAYERLKRDWGNHYSGPNAHKPAILEDGAEFQSMMVGLTAEQAQLINSREFEIQDIARWFGVPLHMIGETTKETSWGSGIEQMSIGFVTYTLMHWLKRWEQAIARDLILAPGIYFAEHNVDALLRGDTAARYGAYQMALGGPTRWMTPNEVRQRENLNPIAGLDDVAPTGSTAPTQPDRDATEDDGDDDDQPGTEARRNGYHPLATW